MQFTRLTSRSLATLALAAAGLGLVGGSAATAEPSGRTIEVTVIIENLAPANGSALTPFWVGFHNGRFDTYDGGAPASVEIERLAEDGNNGPISDLFDASGDGNAQGTIISDMGIPPILPGETATMTFELDPRDRGNRFFSYASMILPSNDAFVANGDPRAHRIFNRGGRFRGADFIILGSSANDAGTELNDELPENTAFFGQMMPNTGQDEAVVISDHRGFKFPGSGGILDDPTFMNGDFLADGYQIARVRIVADVDRGNGAGNDDDDDDDSGQSDDDDD